MNTIGLIGSMSWVSTALYYEIINREVARRLGGRHSARLHLVSVDFQDIAERQRVGDWDGLAHILLDAASRLHAGGADCLLIGTHTMHKLAPQVQAAVRVPLIHIADVTAAAIRAEGVDTVGLMGTRLTMERTFYIQRLARHGIRCVLPDEVQRIEIHRIISEELGVGEMHEVSRQWMVDSIASLQVRGAQGIVLGCTELPLIVSANDSPIPVFDTTTLHALAAVDFAIAN